MRRTRHAVLGLAAWLLVGCAPPGPVRAALTGDLSTLRAEIRLAGDQGKLDRRRVKELAQAVAAREVVSADAVAGAERVRSTLPCAASLLAPLRTRSARRDAAGAEALRLRLALADLDREETFRRYARDPDPSFRALAARATGHPRDLLERRRFVLDPDPRVRRGALESALATPDTSDLEALLEAQRLDPDPRSRSLAARAVGAIGGERAVLGLKDRLRADEQTRLTIVEAWADSRSFAAGGGRELRLLAEGGQSLVSLAAVDALRRRGDADGALIGLLATAIRTGTDDERRLAIRLAPISEPRVQAALDELVANGTPELKAQVWVKWLDWPKRSEQARRELRRVAAGTDGGAFQALATLAARGDPSVVPRLVAQAQNGTASDRTSASVALFRLGNTAIAAAALADRDPSVRLGTACGILVQGN